LWCYSGTVDLWETFNLCFEGLVVKDDGDMGFLTTRSDDVRVVSEEERADIDHGICSALGWRAEFGWVDIGGITEGVDGLGDDVATLGCEGALCGPESFIGLAVVESTQHLEVRGVLQGLVKVDLLFPALDRSTQVRNGEICSNVTKDGFMVDELDLVAVPCLDQQL
jgi:hypothetical protein